MTPVELVATLSDRERAVLTLVARGTMDKKIADELCMSHRTVEEYMRRAQGKLGVERRVQAVVIAAKAGLV
jgi:DNA-binding NarL/FixJ family response regulator